MSGALLRHPDLPSRAPRYPRQFGRYVLLQELGQGGMGQVFLAKKGQMLGIDRYCVIKSLHAEHSDKSEYLGRFLDEARLAVHLNHRNICTVTDVGMNGDTLFMTMDLIVGRDLKTVQERLVERNRRIPEAIALYLVREMLEALDYAHRLSDPVTGEIFSIVHRDVSPANVMLSFEGEVKLIDFGLASSKMKTEHTKGDYVMGKLAYMSPEQAANLPIDARTDQFAASIVAYELLAGERFYEGLIPEAIWKRAGTGEHVPQRLGELDPPLKAILEKSLAVNPGKRFRTCAAFRQAIDDYRMERSLVARSEEVRAFMQSLFPDGLRSHRDQLAHLAEIAEHMEEESETLPPKKKPISVEGAPANSGKSKPSRAHRPDEPSDPAGPYLSEVTPEHGSVVPINDEVQLPRDVTATTASGANAPMLSGMSDSFPITVAPGPARSPFLTFGVAAALVLAAFAVGLSFKSESPATVPIAIVDNKALPGAGPPALQPEDQPDGQPTIVGVGREPTTAVPPTAVPPTAVPRGSVSANAEVPVAEPRPGVAPSPETARSPTTTRSKVRRRSGRAQRPRTPATENRTQEPVAENSVPKQKPIVSVQIKKPAPAVTARQRRPLPTSFSGRLKMVLQCKKPCARQVKKLRRLGKEAPMSEVRRLPALVQSCAERCR